MAILREPVFWIVPGGLWFKYIGMASDAEAVLKGKFFNRHVISSYLKAYALGQMALTKKVWRRKIRGALWK